MISSFFRKNGANGTNVTMHAPKPSPTISPQPLGLKTFAPDDDDDDDRGLDWLCRSHRVDRSRRAMSAVPPAACEKDAREPAAAAADQEREPEDMNACWASYGRGRYRKFPPPIPLLARTAGLSCRMPWVLMRSHRADGSLVIREVRVGRHEYFRVRRRDGRLTLELVELDENSPLFFGGSGKEQEKTAVEPSHSESECNGSTVAKTSEERTSNSTTSPRFAETSSSTMATTEPSTVLAIRTGTGCAAAGCPMSPLPSPMSRMRAVHV